MIRMTMPQTFMAIAALISHRSTCARAKVGCVITDRDMTAVYSFGYNGNVAGGPNACDKDVAGFCGCLHAEDNAIVKLRTEERDLQLFCTTAPCTTCAKRIVNQGRIRNVYYLKRYRDGEGLRILTLGGVEHACMSMDTFSSVRVDMVDGDVTLMLRSKG